MTRSTLHTLGLVLLLLLLVGCKADDSRKAANGAFGRSDAASKVAMLCDLEAIQNSGELIITTLQGPDTYYDYRGVPMGLAYALAEDFAEEQGLKVRVEVAEDSVAMVAMLTAGDADLIAYPMSERDIKAASLIGAGVVDKQRKTSWAINDGLPQLREALDTWQREGKAVTVRKAETQRVQQRTVVYRHVHAAWLSRERGIISPYDGLFRQAAAATGWDWRLIAAQCYQESGFDPNARSWAGAQGLMQIMPATARSLGVAERDLYSPPHNVAAAAKLIRQLTAQFGDVRSPAERCCFVLAAYNGGAGHIRDAMALARKAGHDTQKWAEVAPFVLALQRPRYYRDPVVRHGYMIGSETYQYVNAIMARWRGYGGTPTAILPPGRMMDIPAATGEGEGMPAAAEHRPSNNRYTRGNARVRTPDDPEFSQME